MGLVIDKPHHTYFTMSIMQVQKVLKMRLVNIIVIHILRITINIK